MSSAVKHARHTMQLQYTNAGTPGSDRLSADTVAGASRRSRSAAHTKCRTRMTSHSLALAVRNPSSHGGNWSPTPEHIKVAPNCILLIINSLFKFWL